MQRIFPFRKDDAFLLGNNAGEVILDFLGFDQDWRTAYRHLCTAEGGERIRQQDHSRLGVASFSWKHRAISAGEIDPPVWLADVSANASKMFEFIQCRRSACLPHGIHF